MLMVVTLGGVALVGALASVGNRVSKRTRRAVVHTEEGSSARLHQARAEERAIEAASLPPPPPGSTALLPQIAAQRRFAEDVRAIETSEATAVARGEKQPSELSMPVPDTRGQALKQQLQGVLAHHPDVQLAFVNCEEPDCRVRAQARDLATLQSFLEDPANVSAKFKVRVEAVPTAYNGTVYRADLEGPPPAAPTPGG